LGVSDRHYFAWLTGALQRLDRESGELSAAAAPGAPVDLWVLAGARTNPAIEFARDSLGRDRTRVRFLDRFDRGPDVMAADFNALGGIAEDSCDVLMMTRASYMIEDPPAFLRHARRILRPDGLVIIDWIHGSSDAPRLDLPGRHEYGDQACPFLTTYCDAESVHEFAGEFADLLRHVNRSTVGERVRRALGRETRREVTVATYLDTLRAVLGRAGKHLVEPRGLDPFFKVVFRDARYLHPLTKKFYLHLLTVLRPVGK